MATWADEVRAAIDSIPRTMSASRAILEQFVPLVSGGTKPTEQAVQQLAGLVPVLAGAILQLESRIEVLEGRRPFDTKAVLILMAKMAFE